MSFRHTFFCIVPQRIEGVIGDIVRRDKEFEKKGLNLHEQLIP